MCYPRNPSNKNLSSIKPKHNLRTDKFLLNLSPYGPNNQFRGFRDSIILAYYLNRTVVLPLFFKHPSDPTYYRWWLMKNLESANQKVDVEKLASFVPIVTFEEFSRECNSGIDATLLTDNKVHDDGTVGGIWNQLDSYQRASGIDFTHKQHPHDFERNPKISKIVIWPKSVNKTEIKLEMRRKQIDDVYGLKTEHEKCVFWMMPFRNMKWQEMLSTANTQWAKT